MNKEKLEKAIGDGNIVIPLYILKCYKSLNLTMEEFIFLMYLYNRYDRVYFNPEKISKDLNIDIMEVMGYISVLTDKNYLTLDIVKDNEIIEEVVNLSSFYEKLSFLLMQEETESDNTSLLKYIEKELARPINPTEIEVIESWTKNNISDSLIKEAVRIALNDGVFSLKYIDKILFDWKNRGYKTVSDIQKNEKNEGSEQIELEDWNWLDDEEEYITN